MKDARNARDIAQAGLLPGIPGVTVAALPTAQHSFHTLLTLKRGRANSVARIQLALRRKGGMTPVEALPRASALHAALADAAAAAPDLLSIYAMPGPSGGSRRSPEPAAAPTAVRPCPRRGGGASRPGGGRRRRSVRRC